MNSIDHCLTYRSGALHITSPWQSTAAGVIRINGEQVVGPWSDDRTCIHGNWQLRIEEAAGAFSLHLTNCANDPVLLSTVTFAHWDADAFSSALDSADFRELIHGGSFRDSSTGVKCVGRQAPGLDFVCKSSMVTVYQKEGGGALLLGVLPPLGDAFSKLNTVHSEPHFEAAFGFSVDHIFHCLVEPGHTLSTSPLVALCGPSGTELLADFGALWHQRLGKPNIRAPRVGWNSWDYYAGAVTRQHMDDNLATAKDLFGDAVSVFAIDEGWERQWGDWQPNHKFPEGFEDFCSHVKEEGCVPGVWTAPLLVNTYNPLFLEHPDWFASRADGQLQTDSYSYGPMAYLDVTQPAVIEHLKSVFTRLRQAGFEYFKVDFCQCILAAERFEDPTVGRNALIRLAFAAIREAIGPDCYLLSCGAPYESVVGLVDGVRSTGDIHIFWGHILRNAGALSTRWWMQGNLWNCDPDFLVIRGPDTATAPYSKRHVVTPLGTGGGWTAGRKFNESEARCYALLIHLSGGDVFLGDVLDWLNPVGVNMLKRVLAPRNTPAVPVDLFESDQNLPRIWISRGKDDVLVGLFNWTDKAARIEFKPEQHDLPKTALDFWTGDEIGEIPTRLPRRSSMALRFPL